MEKENGTLKSGKMQEVYVVSDAIISPLGFNTAENFEHLLSGTGAIEYHQNSNISPLPFWASLLDRKKIDASFTPDFEAYTYFEKVCILSISAALKNSEIPIDSERTLILLSTTKGNVDILNTQQFDEKRCYLFESARMIQHYFHNPNAPVIVSNACISGVVALNTAVGLLQDDRYDHVIVCGGDMVSEFTLSGFEAFKALSAAPCKPFDAKRDGTSLGEGAASILLSTKHRSNIKIVAGASSNDANHISGPSRSGDGLYLAVNKTLLWNANPTIDFISAHGTGTIFNDEMESKAFTLAGLEKVATHSLKGFYGHTFGAAGIIESAILLESMRQNKLIPTKGFEEKNAGINLNIISEVIQKELNTCLKTASGFGGCNAAVLFQKCA